ncbi:MAG: ATP-dependent DNA ligase [Bacteroidetes bacterium]|nr:ATP-dependent DNA ligase [Bacteroidota bacterium]
MKAFADLFRALDESNKTNAKLEALEAFFREASEADRLWALGLFSGRRPKRLVAATKLARWAAAEAAIPDWLFAESYHMTGDLAETVSLLLPKANAPVEHSLTDWMQRIQGWRGLPEILLKAQVKEAWAALSDDERLPFNKLLTGGMRLGVSANLAFKGVARAESMEPAAVMNRLSGAWHPDDVRWADLLRGEVPGRGAQPFPFFLAHALEASPEELPGGPEAWFAEWKWDGIRAQLLHRNGAIAVWSRGEEEVSAAFPEFKLLLGRLPEGITLDGELLAYREGEVLNFQNLQNRLNRKNSTRDLLRRFPVILMVYDVLEWEGTDLRTEPFALRRQKLVRLMSEWTLPGVLRLSPELPFAHWEALRAMRERSREERTEGLMLKRLDSSYGAGRKRGDWFKWKVDPYTVDAVLLYAQRGHGRRAGLFTDFTFGVWHHGQLLPFAKAYSGLDDAEVRALNAWIRDHTLSRSGPVVMLEPFHVFELAFEGIARSTRHKSGIALRFPRIHRWRRDKLAFQADTLDTLESLLKSSNAAASQGQLPETGDLFAGLHDAR